MIRKEKRNEVEVDICYSERVQGYLQSLRAQCGLTLTQAAELQNMDRGNLCRYEKGINDMCSVTYLRIVTAIMRY